MKKLHSKNNKATRTFVLTLATVMATTLAACSESSSTTEDQISDNTPVVEETAEATVDVQQSEVEAELEADVDTEVDAEPTEELIAEEVIVAETATEETISEEPQTEMVDFETWAKQEGNEEVCLVVWNEKLGIQEIVPTLSESEKVYEMQEGDRLAIPYRESITFMGIRDQSTWMWPVGYEYYELSLPEGEISVVDIVYPDGVLTYYISN